MTNYVGLLQEKCQKSHHDLPTYVDETDVNDPVEKCMCKLDGRTTNGFGTSKKFAKQHSAQLMLEIIKDNPLFNILKSNSADNVFMKINVFASKNEKELPLISEKVKEDGLFVVESKFDGYTAIGRGSSKKAAKQKALEQIANHFDIDTFYDSLKIKKERLKSQQNSLVQLQELCAARKIQLPVYQDEMVDSEKVVHFIVSCSVNSLLTKSQPNFSKKNAKVEAATLMIDELNRTTHFNTPDNSPRTFHCPVLPEADLSLPLSPKRNLSFPLADLSSSDEEEEVPLAKRKK